jgi:hypothetical protein
VDRSLGASASLHLHGLRYSYPHRRAVGSDNEVELKKMKIGKDLGTHLEIAQGLSPDDRVIINPSDSLASGQIVRIRPSQNEKNQATAAKHS